MTEKNQVEDLIKDFQSKICGIKSAPVLSEEMMKRNLRFMDMANAMYHKAQKYDTIQERQDKLFWEFSELYFGAPGLFMAARDQTLYSGKEFKFVKAFQEGKGDPLLISRNIEEVVKKDVEDAKAKYFDFVQSDEGKAAALREQQKITDGSKTKVLHSATLDPFLTVSLQTQEQLDEKIRVYRNNHT